MHNFLQERNNSITCESVVTDAPTDRTDMTGTVEPPETPNSGSNMTRIMCNATTDDCGDGGAALTGSMSNLCVITLSILLAFIVNEL